MEGRAAILTLGVGVVLAGLVSLAVRPGAPAAAVGPPVSRVVPEVPPGVTVPAPFVRDPAEVAARRIVRLPVSDFPELPVGVAARLTGIGCRIPQVHGSEKPGNVVKGEFYASGEESWAALCSVGGRSQVVVFRAGDGARMEVVVPWWPDEKYVIQQEGWVGYGIGIAAVGREPIERHYRDYGGPKPPPIEHQGLDYEFVGKASVTFYWHKGQWLRLTGSD